MGVGFGDVNLLIFVVGLAHPTIVYMEYSRGLGLVAAMGGSLGRELEEHQQSMSDICWEGEGC